MPIGMNNKDIVTKSSRINNVSFDQNKINKLYKKSTVYPIKSTFLFWRTFSGIKINSSTKIDIHIIKRNLKFWTFGEKGNSVNVKFLNIKEKDIKIHK